MTTVDIVSFCANITQIGTRSDLLNQTQQRRSC